MKKRIICGLILAAMAGMLCSGCGSTKEVNGELQDGYYTAITAVQEFGWNEFVTICVKNHQIVSVEYNAKNPSGFIKSWDMAYMRNMNPISGTYPNHYTRTYAAEFLEEQSSEEIDMLTGATSSGMNFKALTAAVLESARAGDTTITEVTVDKPAEE